MRKSKPNGGFDRFSTNERTSSSVRAHDVHYIDDVSFV